MSTPRQDEPPDTRVAPPCRRKWTVAGSDRPDGWVRANRRAPAACSRRRSSMPTEAKRETVAELKEELSNSTAMIVSEYRGLKVSEIAEIRRALRKSDVSYRVVKNRLMRIAANESGYDALSPFLEGPSAIAFGSGDEATIAKAVLDATRPYKIVKVKGAVLGNGRSIWTGSPGSRRSRPEKCSWPRSPVRSRPRWPAWPACSTPPSATSRVGSAPWPTSAARTPSSPRTRHPPAASAAADRLAHPGGTEPSWQPLPPTRSSKRSRR